MHIMKRDELVAIRSSMINKSLRNPIPWRSQFLTVPCYFSSKLNRGEICNKKARKTEETTRIDCTKDTIQQLTHRIQKFEKRSNDKSESDCKFWRRTYQIVHYVRAFNYCLSHFQLVFSSICLPFNKGNRNWSTVAIFFLFLLQIVIGSAFSSSNSVYPMLIIDATNQEDYDVFNGGTSTTGDSLDYDLQFQTLTFVQQWGNASNVLLVGGLSNIYMLNPTSIATSAHKLHYIERLKWKADDNDQHMCSILGKPKYECHNFIRIVQLLENNTLFVCGTNAFAPKCRYYSRGEFNSLRNAESNYYYEDQCMGSCEVPFSAGASAVFLYANTTQGFRRITALNGQFHGRTSKLLKKGEIPTISSEDPAFYGPEFIKIVSYKNGKAYLFFRETAIAVETGNRPMTYGRVAQVCLNDTGGDTVLRNEWTTFLKARLKCSIPQSGQGQEELTFDNLTSVSDIINITIDGVEFDVVMATFTTPQSWYPVSLSAICIFKMDDIIRLFDTGYFLGESHLQSTSTSMGTYDSYETYMKIPLMGSAIPSPRPGTCSQPGQVLSARNLNFIKHRFLMFEPVMAHQNEPLFVSQLKTRMTEIAVDPQAGYTDHTVVYVGTEDGRVLRIRLHYKQIDGIFEPIYLEEIRLIKEEECNSGTFSCNVRALYVFRPPPQSGEKPVLFVGFSEKLIRIPTSFCNLRHQPECCNFDPECGWKEGRCVQRIPKNGNLPEIINSRNRSLLCNTKPKNFSLTKNDLVSQAAILKLFAEEVYPEIAEEFNETITSLNTTKQKEELTEQLRETFVMTSQLVLRNNRKEYCLKSSSLGNLVNTYPLLLREIAVWHEKSMSKIKNAFAPRCWNEGLSDLCLQKVSFSVPLPLSLWVPMTHLLQEFGAICEESYDFSLIEKRQQLPIETCNLIPGTINGKGYSCSNGPNCQPKCTFSNQTSTVDVTSLFRLANESQNFLSPNTNPLFKFINRTKSEGEILRGFIRLFVGKNAKKQDFQVTYVPKHESVKINFYVTAIRNCTIDVLCKNKKCGKTAAGTLQSWFETISSTLNKPKKKKCEREVYKAKADRSRTFRNIQRKRSSVKVFDNLFSLTRFCIYKTKKAYRPNNTAWNLIVEKARRFDGLSSDPYHEIKFYSIQNLLLWLRADQCPYGIQHDLTNTIPSKRPGKPNKIVDVFVTESAPFIIERRPNRKLMRLKFFIRTREKQSHNEIQ